MTRYAVCICESCGRRWPSDNGGDDEGECPNCGSDEWWTLPCDNLHEQDMFLRTGQYPCAAE